MMRSNIIKARISIFFFFFFVSVAGSQASYVNQSGEEGSNNQVEDHGRKSNYTFLSSYVVYCNCALEM